MQIGMGNMELIMAANQSWSYHSLVELRAQSSLCNGFAGTQVRVMETLEGGKLVTRHWVLWNKEDGKEVLIVLMIMQFMF